MKNKVLFILLIFVNYHLVGQVNTSQINGDFNLSMQSYQEDLVIGAQAAEEIVPVSYTHLTLPTILLV